MTVIGLVGEKGSGKGTFVDLLQKFLVGKCLAHVRSGDILVQTLKLWGIAPTRENLQKLAVIMDTGYGKGTLTNAVYERIVQSPADVVVFDGVRWETDARIVRKFPRSHLLYITADVEVRYERTRKRKEKAGEERATFGQFLNEEQAETEISIPRIGASADFKITNNGSLGAFEEQAKVFYKTCIQAVSP